MRPRFLIVQIDNMTGANALRALRTPSPHLPIIQSLAYAKSFKRILTVRNRVITLPVHSTVKFNESANLDLIESQSKDGHAEQVATAKQALLHDYSNNGRGG